MRRDLPSILTMSPSWETVRDLSLVIHHYYLTSEVLWIELGDHATPRVTVRRITQRSAQPSIVQGFPLELAFLRPFPCFVARNPHHQKDSVHGVTVEEDGTRDTRFWVNV